MDMDQQWKREHQGGNCFAWVLRSSTHVAAVVGPEVTGKPVVGLYTARNWDEETGNDVLREEETRTVKAAKLIGERWLREAAETTRLLGASR